MFLSLVLIVVCLYLSAQSRIEVHGKDTSAIIPIQQLRIANSKFVELRGCREENDSLFSQIRAYTGLTNNLRASITDLKQVNSLNEGIIANKNKLLDISDQSLKKATRKAKLFETTTYSVGGACLVLIAKMFIFR